MRDIEYLLKLINCFKEFDLTKTESYKFLISVREYYTFTDKITSKQMQNVYRISDNLFMYICSSKRIPLRCIPKLT